MHQQRQAELLSQLERLFESICAGPLPVADRLELRRLADALCYAPTVTYEPLPNTSGADAAVTALKRFRANLKRRTDARDGLTSKRLMDLPDDARAILLSSIAFIFRGEIDEWSRQRQINQKEPAKVQRSIGRCLDFVINSDGAMDTVGQKLNDLERSKADILRFMDQDTPPAKVEAHPNIGQLYQRRVEKLSNLLNDESSQQEAVTIIRSLIDRIEITPGEKRGDPQVHLVGGLAAILELAVSGQQKTAENRHAARRVRKRVTKNSSPNFG